MDFCECKIAFGFVFYYKCPHLCSFGFTEKRRLGDHGLLLLESCFVNRGDRSGELYLNWLTAKCSLAPYIFSIAGIVYIYWHGV